MTSNGVEQDDDEQSLPYVFLFHKHLLDLKMTSSYFELICIVLLGLGHMCVFIGNDAQTFLVESVMHSVNGRQPDRIDAHAGYYGLFFSAALLVVILYFNDAAKLSLDVTNSTLHESQPANSREFSDNDIVLMYGAFAAVTVCSNIIFALIPARDLDDCIEGGKPKRLLSFTAEMMGVIITFGSRLVKDFGLSPTMCISSAAMLAALCTMTASVPEWSTIAPTSEPAWLFQPRYSEDAGGFPLTLKFLWMHFSIWVTLIVAFIFGMIDSATNTVRNVACALAMPEARAQAFAISKFYQASSRDISQEATTAGRVNELQIPSRDQCEDNVRTNSDRCKCTVHQHYVVIAEFTRVRRLRFVQCRVRDIEGKFGCVVEV
ncbi:hypothetical protein ANCCEY_12718 [Ancylostoma ceylanicum]|uniref:Uncharacterized protein n=1 Tax=Ancylostoma ceylanicum TaxID=53326 RepID=A0A0D6L934_9BILA|nr:hypothetical protein ANCCEY_12718 [Ancylostoma ceylanicum]